MAPHKKRDVALHYFKPLTGPDSLWECKKCGFKRKQTKNSGYGNLFSHVLQKHKNYQEEMNRSNPAVEFEVCEKNVNLDWIPATSNLPERLFSRAGLVLGDYRKRILPINFEGKKFLFINKTLWNALTVNEIINS